MCVFVLNSSPDLYSSDYRAHSRHNLSCSENIHLKPYSSEADFYDRIYPLYLALLDKAKVFMEQTEADPERTIVFISAGFDACEWEHQGMQRHDRRVPVSWAITHMVNHVKS